MRRIEAYLNGTPVGDGYRAFLVVEEREDGNALLIYEPSLTAFLWPVEKINARGSQLKELASTHSVIERKLRLNRAERERLHLEYSARAVSYALAALQEGRPATPAQQRDDAKHGGTSLQDAGDPVVPNREETTNMNADTATQTSSDENRPAPVKKTTTKKAAPAKKAAAGKKPAKAAAKGKGKEKAKGEGRLGDLAGKTITVKNAENPYKGNRGERYALLKSGLTVEDYIKKAVDKGHDRSRVIGGLRLFKDAKHISVA